MFDPVRTIGGRTRGAGVAAAPLLAQNIFKRFSFLAKDSMYLVFFHAYFTNLRL